MRGSLSAHNPMRIIKAEIIASQNHSPSIKQFTGLFNFVLILDHKCTLYIVLSTMADAQQSLQTYRGNCHCGAFVYEIDVPEIKSVVDCNCSLCFKKGTLWIFLEWKNFRVVKGDVSQLTAYKFGLQRQEHKVP